MAFPEIFKNDGQTVTYNSSCSYSLPSCHIHNHNELLLLISGKLRLENNLEITEVDAPAAIIHNSYTMHRAELLEGQYERYVINFDDNTLDTIEPLSQTIRFFKNANMTVVRLTDEMKKILEGYAVRYSSFSAEDGSRNALTCLILYEIAKYRSQDNSVKLRAPISYINDVMQYISQHYSENFTLDDLAAQFYISRAKLASDFTGSINMTVKQYTTLVRMNVARGMIIDGVSVSETAHACGYNNTSNFTSTFAKYFGSSPARYKSSVGK
ncbi:MAG: helix-turn-helix transcriptional regulator [Clostridia bacterium]|nr:helix-turn-helix transcriptional regulator [Clostridia bacterium]